MIQGYIICVYWSDIAFFSRSHSQMDDDIHFVVEPADNSTTNAANNTVAAAATCTTAATGAGQPAQRGRRRKRKRKQPARIRDRSPSRSLSPEAVSKLIYLIRHRQKERGEWPSVKYLNELTQEVEDESEDEKKIELESQNVEMGNCGRDMYEGDPDRQGKKKKKRRGRKKPKTIINNENCNVVSGVRGGEPASPPPPVVVCIVPEALRYNQGTDSLALRRREIYNYVQSTAWREAAANNLKLK